MIKGGSKFKFVTGRRKKPLQIRSQWFDSGEGKLTVKLHFGLFDKVYMGWGHDPGHVVLYIYFLLQD